MTVGFTRVDPKLGDLFTMNPRVRKVRVLRNGTPIAERALDPAVKTSWREIWQGDTGCRAAGSRRLLWDDDIACGAALSMRPADADPGARWNGDVRVPYARAGQRLEMVSCSQSTQGDLIRLSGCQSVKFAMSVYCDIY
jgi:hypothetical protein